MVRKRTIAAPAAAWMDTLGHRRLPCAARDGSGFTGPMRSRFERQAGTEPGPLVRVQASAGRFRLRAIQDRLRLAETSARLSGFTR